MEASLSKRLESQADVLLDFSDDVKTLVLDARPNVVSETSSTITSLISMALDKVGELPCKYDKKVDALGKELRQSIEDLSKLRGAVVVSSVVNNAETAAL